MRFEIVIKKSVDRSVVTVNGIVDVSDGNLTVDEMKKIPEVEQFLEKLTGLRFHINEVPDVS